MAVSYASYARFFEDKTTNTDKDPVKQNDVRNLVSEIVQVLDSVRRYGDARSSAEAMQICKIWSKETSVVISSAAGIEQPRSMIEDMPSPGNS